MNAFVRATLKLLSGIGVMAIYFVVVSKLADLAQSYFGSVWAGFIMIAILPVGMIWYFIYKGEQFRDEVKGL